MRTFSHLIIDIKQGRRLAKTKPGTGRRLIGSKRSSVGPSKIKNFYYRLSCDAIGLNYNAPPAHSKVTQNMVYTREG